MTFIVPSFCKKVYDNKELSHENPKPCRESRITTCYFKPLLVKTRGGAYLIDKII